MSSIPFKRFTPNYTRYAPELVPLEALQQALKLITESKMLAKLGWVGALVILLATAAYFWLYWTTQDKKLLIEKQLHEQKMGNEDDEAVNDTAS